MKWMCGIQASLDAVNQLSWHIIKYSNLWSQELPGNHTQCNKTNVEIQILYLECQWKPHTGIILSNAGLKKYMDFGIKCIWTPKGCAYIASPEPTECPEPRNQGGMIGHPIRKIWGEHWFAQTQPVSKYLKMNNLKDQILTQFVHRSLWEMSTSWK